MVESSLTRKYLVWILLYIIWTIDILWTYFNQNNMKEKHYTNTQLKFQFQISYKLAKAQYIQCWNLGLQMMYNLWKMGHINTEIFIDLWNKFCWRSLHDQKYSSRLYKHTDKNQSSFSCYKTIFLFHIIGVIVHKNRTIELFYLKDNYIEICHVFLKI